MRHTAIAGIYQVQLQINSRLS